MEKETITLLIGEAFKKIEFVKRYKLLSEKYNEDDYDILLSKVDKKIVLKILEDLGYNFMYSSISKDFIYKEQIEDFSFQLNLNFKNGICSQYIGVYYLGNYIDYVSSNWAFIYRKLVDDINASITSAKFTTYEELFAISKDILLIFSDFKNVFMKQVSETDLNPKEV